MTRARWVAVAALLLAALFAYAGGTYSAHNFRMLKHEVTDAERRVAMLHHQVDSLRAFRDSLDTNPMVQERVARQQWGMVRPGEISITILK